MENKDVNHAPTVQQKTNDDSSSLRLERAICWIKTEFYDVVVTCLRWIKTSLLILDSRSFRLEKGIRRINTKFYYLIITCLAILVINQVVSGNHREEADAQLVSGNREEYAKVPLPAYLISGKRKKSDEDRIDDTKTSISNLGPTNSMFAVISTPLMEASEFYSDALSPECKKTEINAHDGKSAVMYDCPEGHMVLRAHNFDSGSMAIEQHRKKNPEDTCLIVTAIRHPESWFQSYFLHSLGSDIADCKLDEWPSKEAFLTDFRAFVKERRFPALSSAIPDLLNEFSGGSLQDQFAAMKRNGDGHSTLLGPAPPQSIVAGCNLLLLKMEQNSDRLPTKAEKIDPSLEFFDKAWATEEECPNLPKYINVITNYEMTIEEKNIIYQGGNEYVRDWFDAYGYITKLR